VILAAKQESNGLTGREATGQKIDGGFVVRVLAEKEAPRIGLLSTQEE
jgi:hypothetical protein